LGTTSSAAQTHPAGTARFTPQQEADTLLNAIVSDLPPFLITDVPLPVHFGNDLERPKPTPRGTARFTPQQEADTLLSAIVSDLIPFLITDVPLPVHFGNGLEHPLNSPTQYHFPFPEALSARPE
jgi:hypothetical protein